MQSPFIKGSVIKIFSNNTHVKRLAIYFFYDKDGIVDDYNLYLLNDLKENIEKLLVVCNGKLTNEGRSKFETVSDDILVRENVGFDVWAYKEGMEYYGWHKRSAYDEMILLNFTNFGPVYPLKEMFDEMDKRDADFWGIVMRYGFPHDPYKKCKYGYIPDHVPSSFMVIRNSMLCSNDFKSYWDNICPINSYEESICYHEAIFTKDFSKKGYKYSLYIDTEDLKEYWDYPLMLYPLELVKNRRCPVFKRKSFYNMYEEFFIGSCGEATAELYDYLRKKTNYDVNLIWDNILRTTNMSDVKDRMQLNYILSKEFSNLKENKDHKIALVLHIYFEDKIDYCLKYAYSMPENADIYITTDTEKKKQLIMQKFGELKCRKLEVIIIKNRGRDVSALLIGCKNYVADYDYICFAHDKKSKHLKPYIIGESFSYKCFENILGSKNFVKNVIHTFDENPRLGMLVPPPPNHSVYYSIIGFEWGHNYEHTNELAEKLKLTVDFDRHKPPIAPLGTMFWFRPKALKRLIDYDWKYEDFPTEPVRDIDGNIMHAVERIYPFVAQNEGYYTGWLMSDHFARMEITNLYYMLRDIHTTFSWHYGIHERQSMLYLIGHPLVTTNDDGGDKNSELSLKTLAKIVFKKKLSASAYNLLVKVKSRLRL